MIFCDTGPLVALMNRADKHHAECVDLFERDRGPLVIPALIVLEVCQVLYSRSGSAAVPLLSLRIRFSFPEPDAGRIPDARVTKG